MMHKGWSSLEEVPYCFSRPSVKFQSHAAKWKLRFWPNLGVTFEFTNDFETMHKAWSRTKEVLFCFSRSSTYFKVARDKKSSILTQIWCFRTVTPVWLFFKVVCQISRSHRPKTLPILIRMERSQNITQVWIHRWLWNDAPGLKQHRRGALLFSKVIH